MTAFYENCCTLYDLVKTLTETCFYQDGLIANGISLPTMTPLLESSNLAAKVLYI